MTNQAKQIPHKSEKLSEVEIKHNRDFRNDDDLISSLQNKRENRRARQVFEWESARRNDTTIGNDLRDAA
ncbi:MAG: hypothetical protein H7Z37_02425 [Pyrinomonadaceae bacterium]|nr:hypothetical protein [Pyrinomonadaceae bacterium]